MYAISSISQRPISSTTRMNSTGSWECRCPSDPRAAINPSTRTPSHSPLQQRHIDTRLFLQHAHAESFLMDGRVIRGIRMSGAETLLFTLRRFVPGQKTQRQVQRVRPAFLQADPALPVDLDQVAFQLPLGQIRIQLPFAHGVLEKRAHRVLPGLLPVLLFIAGIIEERDFVPGKKAERGSFRQGILQFRQVGA